MITRNELKYIKSLKLKKNRQKENLFVIEGLKNVTEAIHSGLEIRFLLSTEKYRDHFNKFNHSVISVPEMNGISTLKNNSSSLAVAKIPERNIDQLDQSQHIFVLDGVSDPGNLGTIVRSLDWFGYSQLICSHDCSDFYNTKAITATMGSFTRIQPIYVDLKRYLQAVKIPIYGMLMEGEELSTLDIQESSIFVLGSESHGIRPEILEYVEKPITIRRFGNAESLNVAMATTILLHHLRS